MSRPLPFVAPCQPMLRPAPPKGPGWISEVKFDGYRGPGASLALGRGALEPQWLQLRYAVPRGWPWLLTISADRSRTPGSASWHRRVPGAIVGAAFGGRFSAIGA